MPGVAVTSVDVWMDRGVAVVEPLASLYAFDARNLLDALREAEALTLVGVVVLTLDAAPLVDIDALAAVFAEDSAYRQRGGRIALACVSLAVRRVMALCGMDERVAVYPSLEDALRELAPA